MPLDSVQDLSAAQSLDRDLRAASPQAILARAIEQYGDSLALVSSFGAESAVLLHMVAHIKPDLPVLFLDTGMLFGQTLDYRQQLAARLGLTQVRDLRPQFQDLATTDPKADLWKTNTDACCHIRKVLPLDRAIGGFDAWITGRKRFHGGDRLRLAVVEETDGKIKFNPLAKWTWGDVWHYIDVNQVDYNPLHDQFFPSIGCAPCTRAISLGEDFRAGRWWWEDETAKECGLHVKA